MAQLDSKQDLADNVSFCGSFSGEIYSSTRRRNRNKQMPPVPANLERGKCLADLMNSKQNELRLMVKETDTRWNKGFHHFRFIVCIMAGFSFGAMIFNRYIISVAILKMVDKSPLYMLEHPNTTIEDFVNEGYKRGGEFVWDNEIQQMIMSTYMLAYSILQVPSTKLATIIGARWSIPIFLTLCVLGNVLTPILAYWGWQWVIVLRMIHGLGGSAILPLMLIIIENWMPMDEVSLGLTFAQFIQTVLISLQPLVSGYLSSIHWSYAFYVPGLVTILFSIVWICVITDQPEDNHFISQKELDVIYGNNETQLHYGDSETKKELPGNCSIKQSGTLPKGSKLEHQARIGLLDILKVPQFYVYVIIWSCFCGSFAEFNFALPTYLSQFLKIGISHNGIYCAMIQTGSLLSCVWPHPCLSILQSKFKLSLTASRRITHIFLCSMVAATWAYVGFNHNNQLVMFFLSRCFHGSNDIVATGNIMSNFSRSGSTGLAFSMINTIGNLFVIVTSGLTGFVLDHSNQSVECWTWIFLVGAGMQCLMMLLFSTVLNAEPIEFEKLNRKPLVLDVEVASGGQGEKQSKEAINNQADQL